jgi:hypothetical protein
MSLLTCHVMLRVESTTSEPVAAQEMKQAWSTEMYAGE